MRERAFVGFGTPTSIGACEVQAQQPKAADSASLLTAFEKRGTSTKLKVSSSSSPKARLGPPLARHTRPPTGRALCRPAPGMDSSPVRISRFNTAANIPLLRRPKRSGNSRGSRSVNTNPVCRISNLTQESGSSGAPHPSGRDTVRGNARGGRDAHSHPPALPCGHIAISRHR
jgi:hypothetical protein